VPAMNPFEAPVARRSPTPQPSRDRDFSTNRSFSVSQPIFGDPESTLGRCNPIRAAPRARDDVICAFDPRLVAKHGAEQRQLFAAQTLTSRSRRADRAMILRQQYRAVGHPRALGHVALLAANPGQGLRTFCDRSPRRTKPRAILFELSARSFAQQLVHPRLAERCTYRADYLNRQDAVRV